jgi:hypothetical protein
VSWEEMYRREYLCKCGKGTYTEIGEMDDWNRHREYRVINCPECANQARNEAERQKEQQIKKETRLKELASDIKDSFESSYMDEWVAYFKPIKSKKDAWQLAYNIGVESRSLSSFYQFYKGISIEGYAKNLITIKEMEKFCQRCIFKITFLA